MCGVGATPQQKRSPGVALPIFPLGNRRMEELARDWGMPSAAEGTPDLS